MICPIQRPPIHVLGGVVDLPAADESDIEGGAAGVTDEEVLALLICRALGSRVGEAATGPSRDRADRVDRRSMTSPVATNRRTRWR